MFYDYVADAEKAEAAGNEFLAKTGSSWIDVRDLAEAHVLALENQEAGGERIIISGGKFYPLGFMILGDSKRPRCLEVARLQLVDRYHKFSVR